jgi:multidrug transporter EmrE-like cation transporter
LWQLWHLFVGLRIAISYGVNNYLTKKLTDKPSRPRTIAWKDGFGIAMWLPIALATDSMPLYDDCKSLLIMSMGAGSAVATFYHWRAMGKSVTETTLLDQFDDAVAFALACIFLDESKHLTPLLVAGIAMTLSAALAFVLRRRHTKGIPPILWWVAVSGAIWGVTMFGTRYFATHDTPLPTYGLSWHLGSYLVALVIRYRFAREEAGATLPLRHVGIVLLYATLGTIALTCHFLSKRDAPLVVVQPIYQMAGLVLPVLVGIIFFKEKMTWKDMLLLLLSIVGAAMIAASYRAA